MEALDKKNNHHRRRGPRRKMQASSRPSPSTATGHQQHQSQQQSVEHSSSAVTATTTSTHYIGKATTATAATATTATRPRRKLLLLHGSRQTGELLQHRLRKLQKRLEQDLDMEMVAPDAPFPHPEDQQLLQWWERHDNEYRGLEKSLTLIKNVWNGSATNHDNDKGDDNGFCGIMGFSQGARLGHLLALLESAAANKSNSTMFPGLKFVILVAGYDAPLPDGFSNLASSLSNLSFDQFHLTTTTTTTTPTIAIPSLHVWGLQDTLIPPESSRRIQLQYSDSSIYEHSGGHYVPVKAPDVNVCIQFIQIVLSATAATITNGSTNNSSSTITTPLTANGTASNNGTELNGSKSVPLLRHSSENPHVTDSAVQVKVLPTPTKTTKSTSSSQVIPTELPDEETAMAQRDEVEALNAIFPDEFKLVSKQLGEDRFQHPIVYQIALKQQTDGDDDDNQSKVTGSWPPHPLTLQVRYPPTYPGQSIPELTLIHENNVMEFPSSQSAALLQAMREAAEEEYGMPCVLSCVYAAREWLEAGGPPPTAAMMNHDTNSTLDNADPEQDVISKPPTNQTDLVDKKGVPLFTITPSSPERNLQCTLEGLELAQALLGRSNASDSIMADVPTDSGLGRGGSWSYTIGLVGKPSAGKSTFFNAATAFARQRDDADNQLGGATMAPHPFTTIDPNIGYCLVPAPPGSCPEDDDDDEDDDGRPADHQEQKKSKFLQFGSTHGRDSQGRRLIPVMLKDVAGLVPGAYQGRGRGNKFLNDLTDADVLIHVVDASGTADTDGNTVTVEGQAGKEAGGSHPLHDLAWIRQELIEWVYTNLLHKWHTIRRKGRSKLSDMFSGYKQSQSVVWDVLLAVEKFLERTEQRDRSLDKLETWDEGDLHRLVSAFLGVRFPMALALNKCDLPPSQSNIRDVQEALPVHGAHIGVPLSARGEMTFVRHYLEMAVTNKESSSSSSNSSNIGSPPTGVWQCLQSAVTLREPILVFPVADMTTYAPLPSLSSYATMDASLPNKGMIACLIASGGAAPTLWDSEQSNYSAADHKNVGILRDVVIMKPGSSVEDVFLTLKRMGALGGEFVRAEGASCMGEKPKLVPKQELVGKHNRILKIMTNKRNLWQKK